MAVRSRATSSSLAPLPRTGAAERIVQPDGIALSRRQRLQCLSSGHPATERYRRNALQSRTEINSLPAMQRGSGTARQVLGKLTESAGEALLDGAAHIAESCAL